VDVAYNAWVRPRSCLVIQDDAHCHPDALRPQCIAMPLDRLRSTSHRAISISPGFTLPTRHVLQATCKRLPGISISARRRIVRYACSWIWLAVPERKQASAVGPIRRRNPQTTHNGPRSAWKPAGVSSATDRSCGTQPDSARHCLRNFFRKADNSHARHQAWMMRTAAWALGGLAIIRLALLNPFGLTFQFWCSVLPHQV
jgi:hypothetical protein